MGRLQPRRLFPPARPGSLRARLRPQGLHRLQYRLRARLQHCLRRRHCLRPRHCQGRRQVLCRAAGPLRVPAGKQTRTLRRSLPLCRNLAQQAPGTKDCRRPRMRLTALRAPGASPGPWEASGREGAVRWRTHRRWHRPWPSVNRWTGLPSPPARGRRERQGWTGLWRRECGRQGRVRRLWCPGPGLPRRGPGEGVRNRRPGTPGRRWIEPVPLRRPRLRLRVGFPHGYRSGTWKARTCVEP